MNRRHRNGAGCSDASDDSSDDSDALVNRISRDLIGFARSLFNEAKSSMVGRMDDVAHH